MTSATGQDRQVRLRTAKSWPSKVFEVNPAGLRWGRGVMVLDVLLIPLVVFWAIGHEEYLLSAMFGVLFTGLTDPGGDYTSRVSRMAAFGLIGAGVTALGFGVGGTAWGWLVLAVFAVTLVSGLMVRFGVHRAVAALLLDVQFLIALALAFGFHHSHGVTSYTSAQVLAWVGGSALWIAVTAVAWLIRGRAGVAPPIPEIPEDTSRHALTAPVVGFAVLRAVVVAGTVALAFGLDLPHGIWLPIAALVAIKPSLQEATLAALQRLVGALLGAVAAALLLLIPANEHGQQLASITHGLEVVAIVLFLHAAAMRTWNYAVYTGAVAAGVLILLDVPQPADYSAEGYRVLWTLCGVGIAAVVLLLARLLARSTAEAAPQPA